MSAARCILIVEDDADLRDSLLEVLGDAGYQAIGAPNGQQGLDELDGMSVAPCLILLDLMMPVMDGREFRRRQLQDSRFAEVPIVIATAGRDTDPAVLVEMQPAAMLKKPFRIADLMRLVEQHCLQA